MGIVQAMRSETALSSSFVSALPAIVKPSFESDACCLQRCAQLQQRCPKLVSKFAAGIIRSGGADANSASVLVELASTPRPAQKARPGNLCREFQQQFRMHLLELWHVRVLEGPMAVGGAASFLAAWLGTACSAGGAVGGVAHFVFPSACKNAALHNRS